MEIYLGNDRRKENKKTYKYTDLQVLKNLTKSTLMSSKKAGGKKYFRRNFILTNRLLKMSRRLTLGIGDNREHCFYIPVGYHMFRIYIDQGFELEELVGIALLFFILTI